MLWGLKTYVVLGFLLDILTKNIDRFFVVQSFNVFVVVNLEKNNEIKY
jgi:hypothetical protein